MGPVLFPGRRVGPARLDGQLADACLPAASALRTPISITSSYAAPFAMMGHHEMNGSLTSPSAYAGLHNLPPQMSAAAAAAAAAYGRSPMVSFGAVRRPFGSFFGGLGSEWRGLGGHFLHTKEDPRSLLTSQLPFVIEYVSETRKEHTLWGQQTWVPPPACPLATV